LCIIARSLQDLRCIGRLEVRADAVLERRRTAS
jgi:hypothetical protein